MATHKPPLVDSQQLAVAPAAATANRELPTPDLSATAAIRTEQQHTARMCAALRGVAFGHFNKNTAFVQQMARNAANQVALTPRQLWWLTSLVVRHRKQVKDQSAVALAEHWLRSNAEPAAGKDPPMTPMAQMDLQASEARASVTSAPSAERTGASTASDQPTLF